jgi:hypothetical protein
MHIDYEYLYECGAMCGSIYTLMIKYRLELVFEDWQIWVPRVLIMLHVINEKVRYLNV